MRKKTSTSKTEVGQVTLHFDGPPSVASRPRFTRRGFTYYAKSYKDWLAAATKIAKAHPECLPAVPLSVTLVVAVAEPKKRTRDFPRGDVDNYAKGPLDALVKGGVIKDDDYVVALHVTKMYHSTPGITVVVGKMFE